MSKDVSVVSITGRLNAEETGSRRTWYIKIREYVAQVLKSNEDPHFISMGMAIGVFVGCTPTIPFHTVLAITLAFILQGSKTAAVLGSWVCNPLTLPFLYMGSYKIGYLLLGVSIPVYRSMPDILKSGLETTLAMVAGGIVIGIIPGVSAYFLTRYIFRLVRKKEISVNVLHPKHKSLSSRI